MSNVIITSELGKVCERCTDGDINCATASQIIDGELVIEVLRECRHQYVCWMLREEKQKAKEGRYDRTGMA